jgi:hypothetical protein
MRENGELDAGTGESVKASPGISRGAALKAGGLGLVGAFAAFMPGRAGAGVRKKASNASCAGTGFLCIGSNKAKACGYDNYSYGTCYCGSVYYGKIRPRGAPVGACVENFSCENLTIGDACNGPRDCGAGYVCITGSCCTLRTKSVLYKNFCYHYCEQGSQGQAPPLNKHNTAAHK